jgi:hypothetical protein
MVLSTASAGATSTVFLDSSTVQLATAQFASTNGCLDTAAQVSTTLRQERTGSATPVRSALADASLFLFDHCANVSLLQAQGRAYLSGGEFQIDSRLTAAHLATRFRMYDQVSSTYFRLDVDVTWTATGPAQTTLHRFRQHSDGSTSIDISRETRSDANATASLARGRTTLFSGGSYYGLLYALKHVHLLIDDT